MHTWRKMTQGFQKCRQKLAVSLFSWSKSCFTESRNTKNNQIEGKSDRTVTKLSITIKKHFFWVLVKKLEVFKVPCAQKRKKCEAKKRKKDAQK